MEATVAAGRLRRSIRLGGRQERHEAFGWLVTLGLSLIAASAVLYAAVCRLPGYASTLHVSPRDIAFLPIQVLLVTVVLNELMSEREKRNRLRKLNMIIGAFFSEMGTSLLAFLSNVDPKLGDIRRDLIVTGDWSPDEFAAVEREVERIRLSSRNR